MTETEENKIMTIKLLAIAAMSLSLGATSALAQAAQTDTTTGVGTGATDGMQHESMPMEWEGNIGNAFYSDSELGTLRSEEEMRTNWEGLSEEDQSAVRDYCERHAMDDGGAGVGADTGAGADAGTGAATDTGAPTGSETGTAGTAGADGTATAPADPGAGMQQASLRQICEMIEDDNNI
jgi:hypothetical protein